MLAYVPILLVSQNANLVQDSKVQYAPKSVVINLRESTFWATTMHYPNASTSPIEPELIPTVAKNSDPIFQG